MESVESRFVAKCEGKPKRFADLLLNPNAAGVRALQQNGVRTLLILIWVFGLSTLALWLLFPVRLGRKRGEEG